LGWKASQQLLDFDHGSAKQKLQSILERVKNSDSSDSPDGWRFYNVGMLDAGSGNTQQAARQVREALLSPDTPDDASPDAACDVGQQSLRRFDSAVEGISHEESLSSAACARRLLRLHLRGGRRHAQPVGQL
jgi:hypothetical protein